MNIAEFKKALLPDKYYYGPISILRLFVEAEKRYGEEVVRNDKRFQFLRECWIASMYALAIESATKIQYWVQPVYDSDAPDARLSYSLNHPTNPRGRQQKIVGIEVKEWELHSEEFLEDFITRVLNGKAYPENFRVLIYVRRPAAVLDLERLAERVSKMKLKIHEVSLLAALEGDTGDYAIATVYPKVLLLKFNAPLLVKILHREADAIDPIRGFGFMDRGGLQCEIFFPSLT